MSAHIHLIEDNKGDTIDYFYFCSDWCNKDFCGNNSLKYNGWYGLVEHDSDQICKNCSKPLKGLINEHI